MAVPEKYDFCGWATKNDVRCGDGRTIRKGAFRVGKNTKVPLVYNHGHDSISNVLGHAWLEERDEGIYAYGVFNNTEAGQAAKETVKNGDITSLSIYANNLSHEGSSVVHGAIREVSLVVAGANPGAYIESVLSHGMPMDDDDEEGIFYSGYEIALYHAEEPTNKDPKGGDKSGSKTVGEIYNSFTDEQKEVVALIVGEAVASVKEENDDDGDDSEGEEEGGGDMKHSVFDKSTGDETQVLSHSDMKKIFQDAKKCGSLKEAVSRFEEETGGVLMHSIDKTGMTTATGTQTYGFNDPSMLFPDYKTLNTTPEWLSRNMDWVTKVMGGVRRTPFSRIKSVFADITEDEARARGYIKGKQKKEEVFTTLKRTTDPQTVYKKQKLDRDDVIDITDFDVVAWIRAEMRLMLNEEIARAILIGDGRPSDSDDKIQEAHIRPIVTDVSLFNVKVNVSVGADADQATISKETINSIIRARKKYKGSGNPTFWTTEDVLTEMLLLEDGIGHKLYKTEAELATALRVSSIVTVEPMEGHKVDEKPLIGVIVNLADYNVGADKGGEINMFDDFDIDYNQMKYLIETRISGALVKPFSALTILLDKGAAARSQNVREVSE